MAVKYYAVAVGKKPGIYTKWDECKAMVHGFPGAVYKSFKTLEEAETFLESAPARGGEAHAKGAAQQKATQGAAQQKSGTAGDGKAETRGAESAGETEDLPENYAFVDGSFHAGTGVYGYGGFLIHAGGKEVLQGAGKEPEMASMRNVAGEVLGSMAAIEKALGKGKHKVKLCIPYSDGAVLDMLHREAQIDSTDYAAEGTIVEAVVDDKTYGRVSTYIMDNE